jgi:hypothetical protein
MKKINEFLEKENEYYNPLGFSWVYASYSCALCGQSHLRVVETVETFEPSHEKFDSSTSDSDISLSDSD